MTTSVASPQQTGVPIGFTATAVGCTTPEYRFWKLAPGGNWQLVRDWGAGSWTWDTTNNPTGNYTISVWARAVGSANSWDAYKETPYTLAPPPPPAPCSAVNVTTGVASPQQPGVAVPFTATAAGCTSPEYRFWKLAPNSGWQLMRDWSPSGAWTWDTTGNVPGSYTISVWARAVGSPNSWDTAKETPFTLSSPPPPAPCASVNVTTSLASPQLPGVQVGFTAATTGCSQAEYRFWKLAPGGNWQLVRDWSPVGAWAWDTTGNVPGAYNITVWARAVGSPNTWDTAKETLYTLSPPPPCTSVNVTTSVPSPQSPGVSITFTAAAAGCAPAQYRFWLLAPGGSWQLMRDWGSDTAWTWNTAGAVPGSYSVMVWARAAGSTADWEAYKATPFTLQ